MSKELDEIIEKTEGIVVIQITENFYSIDDEIEKFRISLEEKFGSGMISFFKINFSKNKDWIEHHSVFGSPATLIFKSGSLYMQILGRFNPKDILERLN